MLTSALCEAARTVNIVELARGALPLAQCRVLAMFSVYFDESGTNADSPVVVVAGWISTDIQWERFSHEWEEVLRGAELTPPVFHMTDFESRHGPYRDWSEDKGLRILQRLQGLLRRRARQPIIAAVVKADYVQAQAAGRTPTLSPYGFAVMECIKLVGKWADSSHHHEPIAYFFEHGAPNRGYVVAAMERVEVVPEFRRRFRYGSWWFGFKDQILPLQAADFLAYEIYKESISGLLPTPRLRPMRRSLETITDLVPQFVYYDARAFLRKPPEA